jgi:hypothetical protein
MAGIKRAASSTGTRRGLRGEKIQPMKSGSQAATIKASPGNRFPQIFTSRRPESNLTCRTTVSPRKTLLAASRKKAIYDPPARDTVVCNSMSDETDIMNHPEPEHIRNEILEDQIHEKLEEISEDHRDFQTRIVRIGRARLQIHARKRMTRRHQPYYYTPDQLAHLISLELAGRSAELAWNFFRSLDRFLLIPELVLSDRHLLSHIYCPRRRLLAFYLYPRRFDQGTDSALDLNVVSRLNIPQGPTRLGLLGRVIAAIGQISQIAPFDQANGSTFPSRVDGLHKFIVPCELLFPEELTGMQQTHDLYSGSSL